MLERGGGGGYRRGAGRRAPASPQSPSVGGSCPSARSSTRTSKGGWTAAASSSGWPRSASRPPPLRACAEVLRAQPAGAHRRGSGQHGRLRRARTCRTPPSRAPSRRPWRPAIRRTTTRSSRPSSTSRSHGYIEEEFFLERHGQPIHGGQRSADDGDGRRRRPSVQDAHGGAPPADRRRTSTARWWSSGTTSPSASTSRPTGSDTTRRSCAAGFAWVGVSAQRVGVNYLRTWSPARYGSLDVTEGGTITNDALGWDVYSQALQAIRQSAGRRSARAA